MLSSREKRQSGKDYETLWQHSSHLGKVTVELRSTDSRGRLPPHGPLDQIPKLPPLPGRPEAGSIACL